MNARDSNSGVTLKERAYRIRRNAVLMGEVQGQGYVGQALDIADVLAVAYFHAMKFDPTNPAWEGVIAFCSQTVTTQLRSMPL